jgi:hypothetical protein
MVARPPISGIPGTSSTEPRRHGSTSASAAALAASSSPLARAGSNSLSKASDSPAAPSNATQSPRLQQRRSITSPKPVFASANAEAASRAPALGGAVASAHSQSQSQSHSTATLHAPLGSAVTQALADQSSGKTMSATALALVSAQLKTASLQERMLRMKETDVKLEETKSRFEAAIDTVKSGQEQFKIKQREMRETISQFERFIVEQDNKIVKAERAAEQEGKLVAQHRATIAYLTKTLTERRADKRRMELDLRRLARNRHYLNQVFRYLHPEAAEDEPASIISRYGLLVSEQADLERTTAQLRAELERMQNEFAALKKSKTNEILAGTSEIALRAKELEKSVAAAADIETDLKLKHNKATGISSKFGQLQMAIKNLYARVQESYGELRRMRPIEPDEKIVNSQARSQDWLRRLLVASMERFVELDDMLKQWHKNPASSATSAGASSGSGMASSGSSGVGSTLSHSSGGSGVNASGKLDLDMSGIAQLNLKSLNSSHMRLSVSGPPTAQSTARPSARRPSP